MQVVAAVVGESDRLGMQEQPLEAGAPGGGVSRLIAVALVPQDRVAGMREMHADLMRASGFRAALQEARNPIGAGQPYARCGRLARIADDDVALATAAVTHFQRGADRLVAELPISRRQREVVLPDPTLAKAGVELAQRAAPLGEHQTTGGLAVEPVNEPEIAQIGPGAPQEFDDAEAQAAAAMDRQTAGLVDDEQPFVLVDDVVKYRRRPRSVGRLRRRFEAHRRNAHLVAGLELVLGADPASVHPHLATPQQAIDPPPGNARQHPGQIIVDALPGRLVVDPFFTDPSCDFVRSPGEF